MKKITRRNFLLATGTVGATSVLAACGSDSSSTAQSAATSTAASASEPEKKADPENVIWYIAGDKQEDHDVVMEAINKYLLEVANITLDLQIVSDGEYDDRMQLLSMSGEDYDLCFTSNWKNKFTTNIAREGFLALNDLIDQYGAEMQEALPERSFGSGNIGGNIFAVNNYQFEAGTAGLYIRKDLAEKYELDLSTIKQFEDIKPFLQQLVDAKEDSIVAPFQTMQTLGTFTDYENIIALQGLILEHGDDDLVAQSAFSEKFYKPYCDMQYEFYKNGYYQPDVQTANQASLRKTASYAVIFHGWTPTSVGNTEATYGAEYEVIRFTDGFLPAAWGQTSMTAVNVNSKHPEAAVKLMNLVNSDAALFDMLVYGLEGVHYELVDGKVEQSGDKKYDMLAKAWMFGNTFLRTSTNKDLESWKEDSLAIMDNAESSTAPGFVFDTTDFQNELAQTASVVKEYKTACYDKKYEDYAEEFRAKLDNAGYQTLMEGLQAQLDAYKAAK